MKRVACLFGAAIFLVFLVGCGGGNGDSSQPASTPDQMGQGPDTSSSSNSIAGKSFEFTVTMSHNFSEPEGAVYTLDFHSDNTYTFHPSPQNREGQNLEEGSFTYDPSTGAIHFARPDHQDIDGTLTFTDPTSGTAHLMGPEGETEDATFVQTSA
jgi:hypothetical protein